MTPDPLGKTLSGAPGRRRLGAGKARGPGPHDGDVVVGIHAAKVSTLLPGPREVLISTPPVRENNRLKKLVADEGWLVGRVDRFPTEVAVFDRRTD